MSDVGVPFPARLVDIEASAKPRPTVEACTGQADCATSVRATRRASKRERSNRALAERVEYWERSERLTELSSEALHEHYHRDNRVLLESLDYLTQLLRESKRRSEAKPGRASEEGLAEVLPQNRRETSEDSGGGAKAARGDALFSKHLVRADPLVIEAQQAYKGGKVLGAKQKLQQFCKQHGMEINELREHSDVMGLDVEELLHHCSTVEQALDSLSDEKDFRVASEQNGLRVLYKCVKGRHHHIKMEATLHHPLERPLSLAREFDLMSSWNKYVIDSRLLHAPTIWESWVYGALWMPFPFPQIDALATGRGYDLSDEDHSLLISIKGLEEEELPAEAQKLTGVPGRRKRAAVLPGSVIRLEALPPEKDGKLRTKGTILAIVDPHIPHVPSIIVNFVLGVVAPFAHRQIERLLRHEFDDASKPFPQRMAANPGLYDRVRTIVREGLANHYGVQI